MELLDIYVEFRKAQSRYHSRPYKLPKDFGTFFATKISESNQKVMTILKDNFNTRWHNVDIAKYFDCGFELYGKNFSYHKFLDKKILLQYIQRDKLEKRETESIVDSFTKSHGFVMEWMEDKESGRISLLKQYVMQMVDGVRAPIKHYLFNKIDKHYLTYLIQQKIFVPSEGELLLIPLVEENYNRYCSELRAIKDVVRGIIDGNKS